MIAIIEFILHADIYLAALIQSYGNLVYILLFFIVFMETGFVLTPFLPGDSLLFISGAFAAGGILNVYILFFVLGAAAILGDTANYWLGYYFGEKVFLKFIKAEHIEKTKLFFERHGKKTILLARFIPIVRTLAPFMAGVGKMNYLTFFSYNVIGGVVWVAAFVFSGFYFGNISYVKNNLTVIVFLIIIVSLIPAVLEYVKHKKVGKRKIEIIPAVNVESFEEVERAIRLVELHASWIHLDVADGTFTKNNLWHNPFDLADLETRLKLEIHLMILNPEERINDWILKNVKRIIFNLESSKSPEIIIKKCHENNIEVGISIGPDTSPARIFPYLDNIEVAQILSVYPGLSGQKFIFSSLEKIRALNNSHRRYKIEVDGGMDNVTAKQAKEAGADIIVSASYIFSGDIEERINKLKNNIES